VLAASHLGILREPLTYQERDGALMTATRGGTVTGTDHLDLLPLQLPADGGVQAGMRWSSRSRPTRSEQYPVRGTSTGTTEASVAEELTYLTYLRVPDLLRLQQLSGLRDRAYLRTLLCEALVDYDERWVRWRNEHISLVERTLGARTRGTAGMAMPYLERTAPYRFFRNRGGLRHELSVRGGGQLVD
jgi:hypothetical protein